MAVKFENEPMLEIYIFEATQILDQMEQVILQSEKVKKFDPEAINEIFRFMHTIKGSSAMMLFNTIAEVAHTMEDIFYFMREKKPESLDYSTLSDLVLDGVDFIKIEVNKIKNADEPDGNPETLIESLKAFLETLRGQLTEGEVIEKPVSTKPMQYYIPQEKKSKLQSSNYYQVRVFYQDGCSMENLRAYTLVFGLTELAEEVYYFPSDIVENEDSSEQIKATGFLLYLKSQADQETLKAYFEKTIFLDSLEFESIDREIFETNQQLEEKSQTVEASPIITPEIMKPQIDKPVDSATIGQEIATKDQGSQGQALISVHVEKLDKLMNLVGELVIAEAMVTQNPDVEFLESENFHKASRQLHKITGELQDMVMAIRMVPLSTTFVKMHRIVRDMSKKLNKEVVLEMFGEETEVDKNIIEHISDPLMHLIRNAIDHGLEDEKERLETGKDIVGKITLEAKNAGSDVLIVIKDDGRGLDKAKILEKARAQDLIQKTDQELSDREIYNLILQPGFSTKDKITEFSGRGVGMDVVSNNLEAIGGTVIVDSDFGRGSTMTLKIPLTLAIIEGMNVKVGHSRYTIPITSIIESFRPEQKDCIMDPDNNEMVMIRGQCYPIFRIHNYYKVKEAITELTEGILIVVEQDEKVICLFADELLGQQQVVVKSLPNYIKNMKKIVGLAGCTLLGDGNISLILDVSGLTALRVR